MLPVIRPVHLWQHHSLAVNYLFLTNSGSGAQVEFVEEPFNALTERNDYEVRLHSVQVGDGSCDSPPCIHRSRGRSAISSQMKRSLASFPMKSSRYEMPSGIGIRKRASYET